MNIQIRLAGIPRVGGPQRLSVRLGISLLALALALVLGLMEPSVKGINYLVLAGVVLAAFSAFIRLFKSYFLVRTAAMSSYNLVNQLVPDLDVTGFTTMQVMKPMKMGFSKLVGKGYLIFSKFLEIMFISSAAGIAMFYLLFFSLNHKDPMIFLGMYLVVIAVLAYLLEKISLTIPIDRTLEFSLLGLDFAVWLTDAMAVWIILFSLGYFIPFQYLFLPMSIILLTLKVPSYYGLGLSELTGMAVFSIFGVPLMTSFLSVLIWDISRLVFSYLLGMSWRNLESRRQMAEFV